MFGRREFLGGALGSPVLSPVPAKQEVSQRREAWAFFEDYAEAKAAQVARDARGISIKTDDGTRLDYMEASKDIVGSPLTSGDGRGWIPSDGVLDIRHCASASALASDFSGVCGQAIEDAIKNNWVLRISRGDWETQSITFKARTAGQLHIDFAPYSSLIGAANYQHFPGDEARRTFRLTKWASAGTDGLTAMIVHADNSYTILRQGKSDGFDREGADVRLNRDAPNLATGETLVVSSNRPILSLSGEEGDLALRLRGGHFDNGRMGHVVSQASGSCVDLTTIRDLYWDGGPIFENSSRQSVFAKSLLDIHGDSGLILGNVERASIYGAQFLYQPDVGNYSTGLARGGAKAADYHRDDGRFVNFFGAVAKGCGTGFRSARDGGGYGLYGCSVEEGHSGYLSANVSAGLPAARNINIHGLTCRKITYDAIDVRDVYSLVISGLFVEDWGRRVDGSIPQRKMALLSFGKVKHLEASGIRCTYQEWNPPITSGPIISFANGLTTGTRLHASIEMPHEALGSGTQGVWISGGLGSHGDLEIDLTAINIDTPLTFDGDAPKAFVKAKVRDVQTDYSDIYKINRYHVIKGQRIPETTGIPFEDVGAFAPGVVLMSPDSAIVSILNGATASYIRQGSLVRLRAEVKLEITLGSEAPPGPLRIDISSAPRLPAIGALLDQHIERCTISGPGAEMEAKGSALLKLLENADDMYSLVLTAFSNGNGTSFNSIESIWATTGPITLRVALSCSYISKAALD